MKIFPFLFCTLFYFQISFGQALSPDVITSSGDYYSSASVNLTWTIGEVMTNTFSTSDLYFFQGFQQDYSIGSQVSVSSILVEDVFSIYPVPVTQHLNISYTGDENKLYRVVIYNIDGRTLLETGYNYDHQIDLSQTISGYYLAKIIGQDDSIIRTFKFVKQ